MILAVFGMFSKSKKKHEEPLPPPIQVAYTYNCAQPDEVQVDENSVRRIVEFSTKIRRNRPVDDPTMTRIAQTIVRYSVANCLEPELVAALIGRESGFNPNAVSRNGAQGLGQMIPSTASNMGVNNPFDIEDNVRGTTKYFKKLLDMWNGYPDQVERALASYLAGPGTVSRHGGVPGSTRDYINGVFEYRAKMLAL